MQFSPEIKIYKMAIFGDMDKPYLDYLKKMVGQQQQEGQEGQEQEQEEEEQEEEMGENTQGEKKDADSEEETDNI